MESMPHEIVKDACGKNGIRNLAKFHVNDCIKNCPENPYIQIIVLIKNNLYPPPFYCPDKTLVVDLALDYNCLPVSAVCVHQCG